MTTATIEPKMPAKDRRTMVQRESGGKRPPDLANLLLDEISVGDDNHRMQIDEDALATLQASIAEHGLQSPILVGLERDDTYTLIYGHRRIEAVKRLGWTSIDCFVAELPADVHDRARFIHEQRAIENLDRENLTAIDEALAVAALLRVMLEGANVDPDSARPDVISRACENVAEQIGRSATWVRDRAYLSTLSGHARNLVQAGRLPLGHAREICKIADPKQRDELAQAAARQPDGHGGVSLDWIRRRVQEQMHSLRTVPWSLSDSFAGCPACESCPHNSANDLKLFEHDKERPEAQTCLNPKCFDTKSRAVHRDMKKAAEKVAKYCKANNVAATPSVAGQVPGVPVHVKPASVARLAKVTIEGKPAAKKKPARGGGGGYQRSPVEIAQSKYHEAKHKWNTEAKKAFEAAFAGWGFEALVALCLADGETIGDLLPRDQYGSWNASEPWNGGYDKEQRKIAAGFNEAKMRQRLKLIHENRVGESPLFDILLKPFHKAIVAHAADQCVCWRAPNWTLAMAKAFGVTLPEPPAYEAPGKEKPKPAPAKQSPKGRAASRRTKTAGKKAPAKKAVNPARKAGRKAPRPRPRGVLVVPPHPANDPYVENDD